MSPERQRVLDAVAQLSADGWPVSVREVADLLGYASPSTVHEHLRALERDGLIRVGPRDKERRGGWKAVPHE